MKPGTFAASLVAALVFAVPNTTSAQEPKRSPAAAPTTQTPDSQPRDVAVPREVAAPRDVAPKSSPRNETTRGEARRIESSERASTSEGDQDRRGAVRRPPSGDGRGGQGGGPRDRAVART